MLNPSLWVCSPCATAAILEKEVQMVFMVYLPNYKSHKKNYLTFFVANKIIYNLCSVTFSRRIINKKVISEKP